MSEPAQLFNVAGGIARITLNRPQAGIAMDLVMASRFGGFDPLQDRCFDVRGGGIANVTIVEMM